MEVADAAITAAKIYEERKAIFSLFARKWDHIANGPSSIVIFGAGGTGKSTLGHLLADNPQSSEYALEPYDESTNIETLPIPGKISANVMIGPGQKIRRIATWDSLFNLLITQKKVLIINVVSWGYHATSVELEKIIENFPQKSDEQKRDEYFAMSRRHELEAFSDLVPHVKASQSINRMLTIVTKQDLWWKHRKKVKDYYQKNEYNEMIEDIIRHKGAGNFVHEYISCSLVCKNLFDSNNFTICLTTSGYDEPLRLTNFNKTLEKTKEFLNHE